MNKFDIKINLSALAYDASDCNNNTTLNELKDIIFNHKNDYFMILTNASIDFADFFRRFYNNVTKYAFDDPLLPFFITNLLECYLKNRNKDINFCVCISADINVIQGSTAPFQQDTKFFKYCYLIPKNQFDNSSHSSQNKIKNKGENKMINDIDLGQLISLKMLSSISNNEEFDVGKLIMIQSITGGNSVKISDVMKAKLCAALLKDDQKVEDLPLEKLMLYNMFDSGNIDVNSLIQLKLTSKLFLTEDDSDKK